MVAWKREVVTGEEGDEPPEQAPSNAALPEAISTKAITYFLKLVSPAPMNPILQRRRYLASTSA